MKLVPYSVFGRLRLRKWYPNDEFLEEEDACYHLICERVRGIEFFRSTDHPEETLQISLDLFDFAEDHRFEILESMGLSLRPGQSRDEVINQLGEPESSQHNRRNQHSLCEFRSELPEPYLITCHFQDGKGLCTITVLRLDIPFPKSEDELASPPSDHKFLGEFEVLPENLRSPESPLAKVSLPTESPGIFRYIIHISSQEGVNVERAELNIRDANKHETTRIPLCLHTINTETGNIELTGLIDKELLFRAFVHISLRDEIKNTSHYVIVEFDQWCGKYVR